MEHVTLTHQERARLRELNNLLAGYVTMEQAAVLIGVSTRHTRLILAAYRKEGHYKAGACSHWSGNSPSQTGSGVIGWDGVPG